MFLRVPGENIEQGRTIMKMESLLPGRAKIQSPLFRTPEGLAEAKARVEAARGVKKVTGDLAAGTLTILFNPFTVSKKQMQEAREELERLERELG